jgi:tRNA (mo5U34)-methyltransferase
MKFRRWERAGWSVGVGVPEGVAVRLRQLAVGRRRPLPARLHAALAGEPAEARTVNVDPEGRSLVLADPPPFRVERRDPQASVDAFLAEAPPQMANGQDDVGEAIANESWYHTIELPDGTATDGRFDHRPLVRHYGLPDDLSGMRVLDVGTADGFWAFEMERRGAEVFALELPRLSDRDFPAAARPLIAAQRDTPPGRRFQLARAALGSSVELVRMRVYDLDPSALGKFDFVHVGDVLLHLRDPAGALAAIRSVTSGEAHIADAVDRGPLDPARDHLNLTAYHGGWNMTTWWTPSVQTLAQMTLDAGFTSVNALGMYRLDSRGGPGPWRAILRARA